MIFYVLLGVWIGGVLGIIWFALISEDIKYIEDFITLFIISMIWPISMLIASCRKLFCGDKN